MDRMISEIESEELFVARLTLFGKEETGNTAEEAKHQLQRRFEKGHEEWITRYAVSKVFGGMKSDGKS